MTEDGEKLVCRLSDEWTNEWTKLGEGVFLSLLIFSPFTIRVICCPGSIADTQAILILTEQENTDAYLLCKDFLLFLTFKTMSSG